ncbi:YfbM family protein [Pedobacter steynii]|uniref:DUF1877 domain-containing protein n=1 Tax=Pedobacter steynii TaxID=430522 RepID=A0A1D7QMY3_9SPHI|nr:YfbM family protein [Pedobacter steynii]AOM80024.1 hypothetical protein BFS30_24400 [Pedobacter steynii]
MSMIGRLLRVTNSELEDYLKDSSLLEDRIYSNEEDPNSIDIDKAWDGIVYLLTGDSVASSEHPLVQVLFSGQLIDEDQDLGYGPAHYLTPEQVDVLNNEIAGINIERLKQKFDPIRMTELGIYPEIWEEGDEAFDYLNPFFFNLQQFYTLAAKNGEAIITFLN